MAENTGIIKQYGPDGVGYIITASEECFSAHSQLMAPELVNKPTHKLDGMRVSFTTNSEGAVTKISQAHPALDF